MQVFSRRSRRAFLPLLTLLAVMLSPASTWPVGAEEYTFSTTSGLHASIVAKKGLPEITHEYGQKIVLTPDRTGFEEGLEAWASWQDGPAPLAVLLPGMPGRARDAPTRLWAQYLFGSGLHVLALDSVFHPDFYSVTRHGVSGNVEVEATVMARVVEMAIDASGKDDRIERVRLMGISYGGNVALTINELARRGEVTLRPDRVLALSPTLEMRTTAGLLDRWAEEDLESRTVLHLMPLAWAKPLDPGQEPGLSDSLMRAGIAWYLGSDMTRTIKANDRLYDLGLLKSLKKKPGKAKLGSAKNWSFSQFWELMAFPYWAERGGPAGVEAFWDLSGIDHLMAERPGNVRAVVTADDPLNSPGDLERLVEVSDPEALVVLPSGGHLGYTRTDWIREYIESYLGP